MPFPLAHPAAVLPLGRYCPRFLSFPALVAGSLSPDLGYLVTLPGAGDFSHDLLGGTVFGVAAGLLILGLGYALVPMAIGGLWPSRVPRGGDPHTTAWFRSLFLPGYKRLLCSVLALIVSLLLGVWSHLLLDSFTHTNGWLVLHIDFLRRPIAVIHQHEVRLCHLLWYVFSFIGVAWLVLACRDCQATRSHGASSPPRNRRLLEALLVAALVLPIELAHHLVRSKFGLFLVLVSSLLLVLAVIARMAPFDSIRSKAECTDRGTRS